MMLNSLAARLHESCLDLNAKKTKILCAVPPESANAVPLMVEYCDGFLDGIHDGLTVTAIPVKKGHYCYTNDNK